MDSTSPLPDTSFLAYALSGRDIAFASGIVYVLQDEESSWKVSPRLFIASGC